MKYKCSDGVILNSSVPNLKYFIDVRGGRQYFTNLTDYEEARRYHKYIMKQGTVIIFKR